MSGAEVIGIISGIIAIIDATIKISKAANDASGLPEAFRDVALRLPLVSKTLQKFSENKITPDDEWHKAMEPVLQRCKDRATKLQKIFYDVVPQAGASRMKRYALATLTWGKGDTVKSLMKRILEDVQLLTGNRVAELPTQTGVAAVIQEAIERVSAIPPSLPKGTHPSLPHNNERDSLLKELKWTDPTIDKQRIERTKGYLHEASSKWILSHPDYLKWRDGESKLLWVKGGAGKGKTMLLVTITGKLRSQTRLDPTRLDHPTGNSVLSFFFCQNTDNRLNNAVAVLKGLIYLLLSQDVNLVPYLKSECDRMGTGIFDVTNNNVNAFDALSNVFRQMIQHPRSEPMYLVVDALDECEDGLPDLLGLVRETALQENRLKWILTSRNRVDIEENLALESSEAKLSLELNSEAVSQAIENYIDYKVARVSSLRSSPAQQAEIRQKLLEKAEGTFLWVDLALRSLQTVLADDAVRRLDEMPPGLPVLYDRMMGDIAKSTSDYRDSCLGVLSVATLAYRPLHILELRTLAGLRYGTADLERIVDMCGSFLTLVDNYVYPIHQSAKDYLVDDAAIEKIFPSGKHAVQRSIVDRSVAAMQRALHQDVYQLEHPGTLIRDVETRPPTSDPLLGVGYSCTYWIDHVCETDMADSQGSQHSLLSNASGQDIARSENSVQIGNLITPFFQDHFLHWLEALSLLGAVSNVILSLLRLRTIVANWWIIEQTPLQTYVSALLFTPLDSIIRRMFAKEEPGWVLTKPRVDKFWSPCLQTFEGHSDWVMSVALSSDGSRIVSGSCDETVRIWDTKSGKEIQKFEGHSESVYSVAFSLDGNRIISGSADKTIRIWDIKLGKEILRLEGHNDNVLSVAFSSDNSRIVSGSRDETVRIWDIKSGKEIRKLEGHNGFLDNSQIVSGSGDRTIRIWDIKSGKTIQRLEDYSGLVLSIVSSRDGSQIASGGDYDETIYIWDAKSGEKGWINDCYRLSDWACGNFEDVHGRVILAHCQAPELPFGASQAEKWRVRPGSEEMHMEGPRIEYAQGAPGGSSC
ncbi:uncharacterized protein C8A04DRAFT_40548 [Dichotomopilus funicola]|uniref:NACHT domain-containing protein n=1 Tax=Dichotomopilus funicola TaxID=1934379 RepID=A0AAN6ZJG9_9PEZI|nr:hypothetical protein C8A04DRAFT_40548 [Dichotomopilus funicola]